MNIGKQTILITGARAPIALEMCRSFKAAGHRVILVDCQYWTIARWSNSVDRYYIVPSPRWNNEGFVTAMVDIINKEKVSHLIPTCEEAIFIAAHRDEFPCTVWTSTEKTMIGLHNKYNFTQQYTNFLPIPLTIPVNEFTDWSNSDTYVFKPIYSRFASSVIINKKIDSNYFNEGDKKKWIAQKLIKGKEICVYSIWEYGKIKSLALYHPLYRAGKGAGIFFEPMENEAISTHVKNFGAAIQYHGQLCFDVIIDQNQEPYFIECNPRGTSGAHLINSGLAEAFLSPTFIEPDTNKEYAIKYALALLHPLSFFNRRITQSKDTIFSRKDIKPFLFQALSLLEISYLKLKNNCTWLEATTADIEWNGD